MSSQFKTTVQPQHGSKRSLDINFKQKDDEINESDIYQDDQIKEEDINKPMKIKNYKIKKAMVPHQLNFSLTRYNPNSARKSPEKDLQMNKTHIGPTKQQMFNRFLKKKSSGLDQNNISPMMSTMQNIDSEGMTKAN